MSEKRIIKKYPNRRLYDTAISSYITLEDIKKLVLDGNPVQVLDARTQKDITHPTLLQIIIDQEEKGPQMFSTDILHQLIRFYGKEMQGHLAQIFEQGLNFISQQQTKIGESLKEKGMGDPIGLMSELAQKNLSMMQNFQQQWMQNLQASMKTQEASEPPAADECAQKSE